MTVMARSQPLDKQLLVLMLMTRGEVVAVTGDGTNDAPALRLADVGFVMRSGTDIAVKSADIVLLDDNFRSVERAVVWGRCVNDNIRKFLQLQLTVNYASVALTCLGSIAARGASSPLTTVQLLWSLVEKAQQDEKFSSGAYLESARRLQARALWCKARSHHLKGNRIVNNLRGSRYEACLSSERSIL
ncbi:hypothetical protein O3M35_012779 [Rhynocoris fuscipes]|uniref:Uncharacterized protein n=1 Tax=Rhynocoris fuscipes TaxID=488301 RepID=A0AAW1CJU7_9HEMI